MNIIANVNTTLLLNVGIFFKRFANFVLNIFAVRVNLKCQFVLAAVSKIHSQTVTTKEIFREILRVKCCVSFYI